MANLEQDIDPRVIGYLVSSPEENITLGCVEDTDEWRPLHRAVMTYGSGFLLVLGTVGNTVTFCVLRQKSYKSNVMAGALRYLALLDIVVLWTVVLKLFIKGVTDYDYSKKSTTFCMFAVFWSEAVSGIDNWVLVLITLTRFVYVKFPFKAGRICTVCNYYGLLCLTHAVLIGFFATWILDMQSRMVDQAGKSCYWQLTQKNVMTKTHKMLHLSIHFLLPCILLLLFNLLIAVELRAVEARRRALFSGGPTPSPARLETTTFSADNTNYSRNPRVSKGKIEISEDFGASVYLFGGELSSERERNTEAIPNAPTAKSKSNRLIRSEIDSISLQDLCIGPNYRRLFDPADKILQETNPSTQVNGNKIVLAKPVLEGSCRHSRRQSVALSISDVDVSQNANPSMLTKPAYNRSMSDISAFEKTWMKNSIKRASSNPRFLGISTLNVAPSGTTVITAIPAGDAARTSKRKRATVTSLYSSISSALQQSVDMGKVLPSLHRRSTSVDSATGASPPAAAEAVSGAGARKPAAQRRSESGKVLTLTRMLMVATTVFLALNAPFWMFHLFIRRMVFSDETTIGCHFRNTILDALFLLRWSNHAFNFILYCATGSRFRKELMIWLRSFRRGRRDYRP